VYLLRHGRTEWNAEGRLQGRLDSPLLPKSELLLEKMAACLRQRPISRFYASPLARCVKSAGIISKAIGVSPVFCGCLVECSHGECEGMTLAEVGARFKGFLQSRAADKWNARWPSGESYADIFERAGEALELICQSGTTLIVAHETLNKVLAGRLLDMPPEDIMGLKQKNSEIYRIDLQSGRLEAIDCEGN
jgi:probable phosphoglycerate mutase